MTDPFAEFVRMVARMKHSDDADDALATVESLIEQARSLASRIPEPGEDDVERVARALWGCQNPGMTWQTIPESWRVDYRLKARAALSAMRPAAAEGWRPIETAPKDGTIILLWIGSSEEPWGQTGRFAHGCWRDSYENEELAAPTHWMPLPAAPAQGGRDE